MIKLIGLPSSLQDAVKKINKLYSQVYIAYIDEAGEFTLELFSGLYFDEYEFIDQLIDTGEINPFEWQLTPKEAYIQTLKWLDENRNGTNFRFSMSDTEAESAKQEIRDLFADTKSTQVSLISWSVEYDASLVIAIV